MKFYYVLANQLVTLLLSGNTLTTLHFNEEISYCDTGAGKTSLLLKYRRQKTSVALAPFSKIDSNMSCFMKSGKIYVFNLKWSNDKFHKNIVVDDAVPLSGGKLILETLKFRLYESEKSYYIENKTKKKIHVNEYPVVTSAIISKWLPIVVDGKEYRL